METQKRGGNKEGSESSEIQIFPLIENTQEAPSQWHIRIPTTFDSRDQPKSLPRKLTVKCDPTHHCKSIRNMERERENQRERPAVNENRCTTFHKLNDCVCSRENARNVLQPLRRRVNVRRKRTGKLREREERNRGATWLASTAVSHPVFPSFSLSMQTSFNCLRADRITWMFSMLRKWIAAFP
jgi:hypothetical protein